MISKNERFKEKEKQTNITNNMLKYTKTSYITSLNV